MLSQVGGVDGVMSFEAMKLLGTAIRRILCRKQVHGEPRVLHLVWGHVEQSEERNKNLLEHIVSL